MSVLSLFKRRAKKNQRRNFCIKRNSSLKFHIYIRKSLKCIEAQCININQNGNVLTSVKGKLSEACNLGKELGNNIKLKGFMPFLFNIGRYKKNSKYIKSLIEGCQSSL